MLNVPNIEETVPIQQTVQEKNFKSKSLMTWHYDLSHIVPTAIIELSKNPTLWNSNRRLKNKFLLS